MVISLWKCLKYIRVSVQLAARYMCPRHLPACLKSKMSLWLNLMIVMKQSFLLVAWSLCEQPLKTCQCLHYLCVTMDTHLLEIQIRFRLHL